MKFREQARFVKQFVLLYCPLFLKAAFIELGTSKICNTFFGLLILLKFCWQSDFLLSSESFEGFKLPVKSLHLLPQVDVVVLELVQVLKLLPLLALQLVLLLQSLDPAACRVTSVLQRSTPFTRKRLVTNSCQSLWYCSRCSPRWARTSYPGERASRRRVRPSLPC